MLSGDEEKLPEVGKYNAGQKLYFWLMSITIVVLFLSGIVTWQQYFGDKFSVDQKRLAVLVHSMFAIGAICLWIVHVYAAIWVRGTIGAMTKGTGDRRLGLAASPALAARDRRRKEGRAQEEVARRSRRAPPAHHVARAVREE